MECRRCAGCGRRFRPCLQVKEQRYCGLPACQRERRRRWKWNRRQNDEDYRQTQALAHRAWSEAHPGYWRDYRESHPDYVERNRVLQRERDLRRRVADLAKGNASEPISPVSSGIYRMEAVAPEDLAKRNAWTVKIVVLSSGYDTVGGDERILQKRTG